MDKYQYIAKRIERTLIGRGMSKKDFADKMNTMPSMVTKWLSGKHNFTLNTLFKIEEVLHINFFVSHEQNFCAPCILNEHIL